MSGVVQFPVLFHCGYVIFKDPKTSEAHEDCIGENYAFDISVKEGSTNYESARRNGDGALATSALTKKGLFLIFKDPREALC